MVSKQMNIAPENRLDSRTHYKVRVPTERFVRIYEAEPGMELSRDVITNDGQLLSPGGTTLDIQTIQRLKNFDCRGIYVRDTKTRWVEYETYESLSDEAEYVDEKEVPISDPAESEDSDEAKFQRAYQFLDETESISRLRKFVESLGDLNLDQNQEVSEDDLGTLRERTEHLEDMLQYLRTQLQSIENPEARRDFLKGVYGLLDSGQLFREDDELPEDMAMELNDFAAKKELVKNDLVNIIHGDPRSFDSMESEEIPELLEVMNASDSDTEPEAEESIPSSLLHLLLQLETSEPSEDLETVVTKSLREGSLDLEEFESDEFQWKFKDLLQKLGGTSPDEVDELTENLIEKEQTTPDRDESELNKALDDIAEGRVSYGLEMFSFYLEQLMESDSPELSEFSERSNQLRSQRNNLINQLEKQVELPPDYEDFKSVLNQPVNELRKVLSEIELPPDVADLLGSYLSERQQLLGKFREVFGDETTGPLEVLSTSTRDKALEIFRQLEEDFVLDGVNNPPEVKPKEPSSTRLSLQEKREEILEGSVEELDLRTLKKLTSLPYIDLDQIGSLYQPPEEMNKWQTKLFEKHQAIFNQLIYGLSVPRQEVDRFLYQCEQVLKRETKPFSLFVQPPVPRKYHLVHAFNTSLLSLMLVRAMEGTEEDREALYFGSSLADVGMTIIPNSFYLKQEELTRRAESEISKHPIYSQQIASQIFGSQHTVTELVGDHHERIDGTGYPQGRGDDELSRLGGIIGVADAYTAMIEDRVYRKGRMPDDASSILNENSQSYPDEVLEALHRTIGIYPNGSVVMLSDRRLGFVHQQNPSDPREPKVYIITDEQRNRLDDPIRSNLAEETEITVVNLLRVY